MRNKCLRIVFENALIKSAKSRFSVKSVKSDLSRNSGEKDTTKNSWARKNLEMAKTFYYSYIYPIEVDQEHPLKSKNEHLHKHN